VPGCGKSFTQHSGLPEHQKYHDTDSPITIANVGKLQPYYNSNCGKASAQSPTLFRSRKSLLGTSLGPKWNVVLFSISILESLRDSCVWTGTSYFQITSGWNSPWVTHGVRMARAALHFLNSAGPWAKWNHCHPILQMPFPLTYYYALLGGKIPWESKTRPPCLFYSLSWKKSWVTCAIRATLLCLLSDLTVTIPLRPNELSAGSAGVFQGDWASSWQVLVSFDTRSWYF
jgi:hypothetical protein